MAQTTPNFGFNIAEGTDTVNLLTQCYPNFTSLDSILQAIKESGVTTAVATKTGTNFAVVRTDTDCNFFRFIATANYAAGDTFTVDGVAVTATSPAGTALPAGAFVINQSVIAVVNSSVLTLFVGGGASNIDAEDVEYDNSGSGLTATDVQAAIDEVLGDIPTGFAATAISYDNTGSGLTATNAQDAIDELNGKIASGDYVEVVTDGIQNNRTLLNALYALIDFTKITQNAKLCTISASGYFVDVAVYIASSGSVFSRTLAGSGVVFNHSMRLEPSNSSITETRGTAQTDVSTNVESAGLIYRLYY